MDGTLHLEWVREVRDQCIAQGVAFFFRQWGGVRPKTGGRELDGREWSEFPEGREVEPRHGETGATMSGNA